MLTPFPKALARGESCEVGSAYRHLAVTHAGPRFHADDVVAGAIMAELGYDVVRSDDPELHANAAVVFDTGQEYDPERGRFDHHFVDPPTRPLGDPYSSAGLVWKEFGPYLVEKLLYGCLEQMGTPADTVQGTRIRGRVVVADVDIATVVATIDRVLIRAVDLTDNAKLVQNHRSAVTGDTVRVLGLPEALTMLNPSVVGERCVDMRYKTAVILAREILVSLIEAELGSALSAPSVATATLVEFPDTDRAILELPSFRPFHRGLWAREDQERVHLVMWPDEDTWVLKTPKSAPMNDADRFKFPPPWRDGKDGPPAGVPGDPLFIHPNGFIARTRTREDALKLGEEAFRWSR